MPTSIRTTCGVASETWACRHDPFLQQFETGSGDYAKERHAWVDATSFEEIRAAARRKRLKQK
jgi:hypothetical protein